MSQTLTQQPPSLHDDVRTRVWFENGAIVRENYQPTRNAVLREVEARRNNPGSVRDVDGLGRCALTIPQLDLQRLFRMFPDLKCPDGHVQTAAWKKFLASSLSEPYRNHGGRNAYRKSS